MVSDEYAVRRNKLRWKVKYSYAWLFPAFVRHRQNAWSDTPVERQKKKKVCIHATWVLFGRIQRKDTRLHPLQETNIVTDSVKWGASHLIRHRQPRVLSPIHLATAFHTNNAAGASLHGLNLTSGMLLDDRHRSHTHSAYTSCVSRWKAASERPVHILWNQKLQPLSQRIAWSLSCTSLWHTPHG